MYISIVNLQRYQERGWAWTRALLGVPAKEIHVCGDGTAVDIVQRIGSMIGMANRHLCALLTFSQENKLMYIIITDCHH